MQIEIKIDSSCTEPKIIIQTASITEEINTLMQRLSENNPPIITGVKDDKTEIINLNKVKNFDLSFSGTIYVELTNGTTTYVSRRYVSKIKKILGM